MASRAIGFIICFSACLWSVKAYKDKASYCAACRVLVDELEYEISKEDPRKTLQVEGFRVDPQGNQKSKEIAYARSETHLTELLETLCDKMNTYGMSTDKQTGAVKFIRTKQREGEVSLSLENVSISSDVAEKLRFMCNNLIEDHEEEMIDFFKKLSNNPDDGFCRGKLGLCGSSTIASSSHDGDDDDDEEDIVPDAKVDL